MDQRERTKGGAVSLSESTLRHPPVFGRGNGRGPRPISAAANLASLDWLQDKLTIVGRNQCRGLRRRGLQRGMGKSGRSLFSFLVAQCVQDS